MLSILFLLLSLCACSWASFTFTTSDNVTVSVATVDYFERPTAYEPQTGYSLTPPFTTGCTWPTAMPHKLLDKAPGFVPTNHTILTLDWRHIEFQKVVVRDGWPPCTLVVIVSPADPPFGFGGPLYREAYTALTSWRWTDEALPEVDVAMMQIRDGVLISHVLHGMSPVVTVVHEQGEWNRVFLNAAYIAVSYALAIVNIVLFVYGVYRLVLCLRSGNLAIDFRNGAVLLGLVATACTAIYPFCRVATHPRYMLEIASAALQSAVRALYLVLWSHVLARTTLRVPGNLLVFSRFLFLPIRVLIVLGLVGAVWEMAFYPVAQFDRLSWTVSVLTNITWLLIPMIKYAMAVAFGLYAWRFRERSRAELASETSRKALLKFTHISAAGMLVFVVAYTLELVSFFYPDAALLPMFKASFYTVRLFLRTVENAVVLVWLNVKVPTMTTRTHSQWMDMVQKAAEVGDVARARRLNRHQEKKNWSSTSVDTEEESAVIHVDSISTDA